MSNIKLTKDGRWIVDNYDEDTSEWNDMEVEEGNLPNYINRCLSIEEGTTFGTFVEALAPYVEELDVLTGYFLAPHVEYYLEHKNEEPENTPGERLDYVYVYYHMTINFKDNSEKAKKARAKRMKNFKLNVLNEDGTTEEKSLHEGKKFTFDGEVKSDVECGIDFSGAGVCDGEEITNFAMDFCTIGEIAHLPFKLENNYDIIMEKDYPEMEIKEFIKDLEYHFSLKEVIETVFYELSFHGTPESVLDTKQELFERKDEVEKAIENHQKLEKDKKKLHNDIDNLLEND